LLNNLCSCFQFPFSLFLLLAISLFGQSNRETRAVWVASNFRLDWPPPTYNQTEQKASLIQILDNIERLNLNTVYFQVRFNGTVLFNSSFEPWSYYLTGEVNGTPDYDPLNFVIAEAHKRGIEVHAWFNMLKCFDGMEQQVFDHPEQIMNKHSNWVHKVTINDKSTYWLDPGLPEVQEYLVGLVTELAENYNVDGIHLDYIRYPSRAIDDSFTFSVYGNEADINQWRRDNITAIVRGIKNRLDEINSSVKLGAAPIGIYKNKPNASGLQAYHEIYQASRDWLKDELVDYLAPQIYWNMQDNPRFNLVVDDWVNESYGRNIVVGIASYKEDVKSETPGLINYSRKAGAQGIAFFRYKFIEDVNNYFNNKALPAVMPWKPNLNSRAPDEFFADISLNNKNRVTLSWSLSKNNRIDNTVKYFGLYELEDIKTNSLSLFKVLPVYNNKLSFRLNKPSKLNYHYTISALDRYWNESEINDSIQSVQIQSLKSLYTNNEYSKKPVLISFNNTKYIIINSEVSEGINIFGFNLAGISKSIVSTDVSKGINLIELKSLSEFDELLISFKDTQKEVKINLN
jgi:uncharacterized lipoprotein YddW (UPF0748 family)